MKKLLILIPAILLMACSVEVDLTFDKETSGPSSESLSSESNSSTSNPITSTGHEEDSSSTSIDSTSINSDDTSMNSSTTSDSNNTMSCMISRDKTQVCPSGLVCVALSFTQEGKCLAPCIDSCSDDLICQDWTAMSQPQLPSGIGVCM